MDRQDSVGGLRGSGARVRPRSGGRAFEAQQIARGCDRRDGWVEGLRSVKTDKHINVCKYMYIRACTSVGLIGVRSVWRQGGREGGLVFTHECQPASLD